MFNHIFKVRIMPCLLLLLLAGTPFVIMGSATSDTLYKYNISGTIYSTSENGVDKVMPNMQIHLKEADLVNADDDLGHVVTDGQGHFEGLVGEEDEGNEPEPFLRIPINYCDGVFKKSERVTVVGLLSTPERQNLSVYLGYKSVAYLHREGQEDLTLKVLQCQGRIFDD